jgi:hypothetical protein
MRGSVDIRNRALIVKALNSDRKDQGYSWDYIVFPAKGRMSFDDQ